jgi:hypothetical protein
MNPKTISHPDPTPTQLRVFAVLLPVFFLLLGLMAMRRPHGLVVAAGVCTAATLIAVAIDAKNRANNLVGLSIPLLLMLIALPVKMGTNSRFVAATCVFIGVLLGVIALISRPAGQGIYDFWMRAAEPIGHTLSIVMLVLAFYLVFMPVGLIMRLLGKDPLSRAFDRQAGTYWVEHNPAAEPERYFKQF